MFVYIKLKIAYFSFYRKKLSMSKFSDLSMREYGEKPFYKY